MKKENMYAPSGLKTRDGKDIMCYTAEFYVKNKDKIDRITNASRIINNEMRKQRKAGLEEGIAIGESKGRSATITLIAKKLKGKMHIKDISQITGLSKSEINLL